MREFTKCDRCGVLVDAAMIHLCQRPFGRVSIALPRTSGTSSSDRRVKELAGEALP